MKVLLDENLPVDLRHLLSSHEVITVSYLGWKGLENGALLARAAEHDFDIFVSRDTGIQFQQNVATLPLTVVLVHAPSNALDDIRPLVDRLLAAMTSAAPRSLVHVK